MKPKTLPERRAACAIAVLVGPMKAAELFEVSHTTIYGWALALGMTLPRRGMNGTMKRRPPARCGKCGKR